MVDVSVSVIIVWDIVCLMQNVELGDFARIRISKCGVMYAVILGYERNRNSRFRIYRLHVSFRIVNFH